MLKKYTDIRYADLTYSEVVSFRVETKSQEEISAIEDNDTSFHASQGSSESQTTDFCSDSNKHGEKPFEFICHSKVIMMWSYLKELL